MRKAEALVNGGELGRVRHLFISDAPECANTDGEAFSRLIMGTCTTLQSLTVVLHHTPMMISILGRVFRMHFPQLVELNIDSFYPFPGRPDHFPKLHTLHLGGVRNPNGLLQAQCLASFPSLDTIGIHGVNSAPAFAKEVEEVLSCAPGEALPKNAVELIVGYTPFVATRQKVPAALKHEKMLEILEGAASRGCGRLKIQVVEEKADRGADVVRRDWEKRWSC